MKGIHAIVIETDGQIKDITLERDSDDYSHADALHKEVGGYFDHVNLRSDLDMWVHDMGAYELQPNPCATLLAEAVTGRGVPLFGRVVITGGVDDSGDTLSISGEAESIVRETISLILLNYGDGLLGQVTTRIHIWAVDAVGRNHELTPVTPGWEWKV